MDHSIRYTFLMCVVIFLCVPRGIMGARSPHRPKDPLLPEITAHWVGDTKKYVLRDSHLEYYPYFSLFNKDYLLKYELPDGAVSFRNAPDKNVPGTILKTQIEELIAQFKKYKFSFKHFIVLQDKDFNYRHGCGLLVLKFKDYPFVLKLFIETPECLVNPYGKGIEPIFFFFMGGGVNRHLTGFTRIRNRELVRDRILQIPDWQDKVDFPRKWFWIPTSSRNIQIEGKNLKDGQIHHTIIPGTYCIIADEIIAERSFSIQNAHDRKLALKLCNDMNACVDPHIKNFMIEKDTNKLIIVDTEHFPSAVGFKQTRYFRSYTDWYFHLISKCGHDMLFRTKRERRANARDPQRIYLTYQ